MVNKISTVLGYYHALFSDLSFWVDNENHLELNNLTTVVYDGFDRYNDIARIFHRNHGGSFILYFKEEDIYKSIFYFWSAPDNLAFRIKVSREDFIVLKKFYSLMLRYS